MLSWENKATFTPDILARKIVTKKRKKFDSASSKAFASLPINELRSKYISEKINSPAKQTSMEKIR